MPVIYFEDRGHETELLTDEEVDKTLGHANQEKVQGAAMRPVFLFLCHVYTGIFDL